MKHTKRYLVALLAVLMLLPALAACAETDSGNTKPTASPTENPDATAAPTDEAEKSIYDVEDTLPALDYDGAEFVILYLQEKYVNNFFVDMRTGDLVDDAVFDAVSATEEKLHVDVTARHSGAADEYKHRDLISTQISSGDAEFDMTRVHDVLGANLSIDGYFLNLYDLDYLRLEEEWWIPQSVQSLTFKDKIFLVSSAMSYQSLQSANVVFFNKSMMDDRGIEYPYAKVNNMDWYFDEMLFTIEDVYTDTNNDGNKDTDDIFGISVQSDMYAVWESFGVFLAIKSEDNQEIILNGNDERAYDLIEKFYNICFEYDGGILLRRDNIDGNIGAKGMFTEGRAVYTLVSLGMAVAELRNVDIDYGIVPVPMLEQSDDQYYAGYTDRYFAVPNTCSDMAYTGAVMESLSIEGYRHVTPAYFETALKDRYSRDAESKAMMDIIRRSMVLDFAYVYGDCKWWSRGLHDLLDKHSKDYASFYESLTTQAEARVDIVTAAFERMD